jgi:hypothetical protein
MPNWTNNTVLLSHEDTSMIARAKQALADEKFFSEFCPCPQELKDTVSGFLGKDTPEQADLEEKQKRNLTKYGYKDWWTWCVNEWGTKWDICEARIVSEDEKSIFMTFDTAWSPPIQAYEKLADLGFYIKAYYFEGGMMFCGSWIDGLDEYYEIEEYKADWVRENIPSDIDETMGISEDIEFNEEHYGNEEEAE